MYLSVCPQVEILFNSMPAKLKKVQESSRERSGKVQGRFLIVPEGP